MDIKNKIDEIKQLMKKPETRITIYNNKMIDQLIELASKDKQIEEQNLIDTLNILQQLIQNVSELEIVAQTNAFYFVCQILKDEKNYSQQVILSALTAVQSFVQTEDTCFVLIKYHKILNLLSSLPEQCEQTPEIVQKIAEVLYTMMICYPKCTEKIISFGFSGFYIKIINENKQIENNVQNQTILFSLLVMERFAQIKQQIQYFIQQKFDQTCFYILDLYIQQVQNNKIIITDENINILLNIISSFAIQQPQLSVQFINDKILLKLRNLLTSDNISVQVKRFVANCFVEIFYANKGHHYSNVQDMLRTLNDSSIDQSLKIFIELIDKEKDNDLITIYSQLIKMICSVPKKDDFIRQALLQNGMLKTLMDQLLYDKYNMRCYQNILEAMSQLLCTQKLDKETLMTDVPRLIAIVKRTKREWSSKEHKKDPEYQDAIESARKVLEKVGDSEGRDNRKARQLSYIIVCVSVIIGASISLLIH